MGCEELCHVQGDNHELVLLGYDHGQGGVVVRGCDGLGSA